MQGKTYDAEFIVWPGPLPPKVYTQQQPPQPPSQLRGLGEMDDVTKLALGAAGLLAVIAGVAMYATSKSVPKSLGAAPGRTPKLLEHCVISVQAEHGYEKGRAFAICTSSLQRTGYLKKGTRRLTKKGRRRSAQLR